MKITRYINGTKVSKPINSDIVIENEAVYLAIERVNSRFLAKNEKKQDE